MTFLPKLLSHLVAQLPMAQPIAQAVVRRLPMGLFHTPQQIATPDPATVVVNINFGRPENLIASSTTDDGMDWTGPWRGLEGYDIAQ
jgi:hypothetical protein